MPAVMLHKLAAEAAASHTYYCLADYQKAKHTAVPEAAEAVHYMLAVMLHKLAAEAAASCTYYRPAGYQKVKHTAVSEVA